MQKAIRVSLIALATGTPPGASARASCNTADRSVPKIPFAGTEGQVLEVKPQ